MYHTDRICALNKILKKTIYLLFAGESRKQIVGCHTKMRGPTKWFHWHGYFFSHLLILPPPPPIYEWDNIQRYLLKAQCFTLNKYQISFFFLTYMYWNLTALSVQSRSLKVTAILNETSFRIFKSELTEIIKNIVEIR